MLSPTITPNHTAVMFAPGSTSRIGATMGMTTTAISMKSRKNPSRKITAMTTMNCVQNPPGQAGEVFAHQILAAEGAERGGQHGGADEDDEDHRGGLRGLEHHPLEGVPDGMGPPQAPEDGDEQSDGAHQGQRDATHVFRTADALDVDVVEREYDQDFDDGDDRDDRGQERAAPAGGEPVPAHDHGPRSRRSRRPGSRWRCR